MRVISPLAALACALILSCIASAQTKEASLPISNARDAELGIIRPLDSSSAPGNLDDSNHRFDSERDKVCYMLRTYRMKRERPDSDATESAGSSTCQRASKFGVKKAEQSGKSSSH
jgi:hypothetical protein